MKSLWAGLFVIAVCGMLLFTSPWGILTCLLVAFVAASNL